MVELLIQDHVCMRVYIRPTGTGGSAEYRIRHTPFLRDWKADPPLLHALVKQHNALVIDLLSWDTTTFFPPGKSATLLYHMEGMGIIVQDRVDHPLGPHSCPRQRQRLELDTALGEVGGQRAEPWLSPRSQRHAKYRHRERQLGVAAWKNSVTTTGAATVKPRNCYRRCQQPLQVT